MNEKDSQNLEYILEYLSGEKRQQRQLQNNEYLRGLKELVYFWKDDNGIDNTLSKILEELKSARRERNYQLLFLGLIMISVGKMAFG
jgi:hypothetical protein